MHSHDHAAAPVHDDLGEDALAELLDLDGEALRAYWSDAVIWVRTAARNTGRLRIVDLGAGTGVGTVELAQRFAGAEVVAVDASEPLLQRVRAKALDLGLAPRVRTVRADLDAMWPALGDVDLTWASMSMHHLADPARVLAEVFAATRPGGLIAVAEFAEQLRFLPDELGFGRPALETRCLAALDQVHAEALPHLGDDWAARLAAAGFGPVGERTFSIELDPPHSSSLLRYADRWLRRLRSGPAQQLDDDDRAALDRLLDGAGPDVLPYRGDLRVRGSRTVTLARRPGR